LCSIGKPSLKRQWGGLPSVVSGPRSSGKIKPFKVPGQAPVRTYIYKVTNDRGGAPCAPRRSIGGKAFLSLALCKPVIRRTAEVGDRLLGITSYALARSNGYPLRAVVYAAVVTRTIDARTYFALRSPYRSRPDCIYQYDRDTGIFAHDPHSSLHLNEAHLQRDLGHYPYYRNAKVLLSADFRYCGRAAVEIPRRLTRLSTLSDSLGQGHRVIAADHSVSLQLEDLFKLMWKKQTLYTPAVVAEQSYDRSRP
jgi:Nucleotide modification associated domain 2